MKILNKISMWMLAGLLFAAGCGKDKIEFTGEGGGTPPQTEVGYLALAGMNLGVSVDVETLESSNGTRAISAIRTPEVADDTYLVVITNNATDEIAWSGTYGEIKAMTAPLELFPGRYIITANSPDQIQPVAWERPEYAGSTEFTIVRKITTEVKDLVCRLSNIKTTVELSADLKMLFLADAQSPLMTTVSLEQTVCEFSRDEDKAAFFAPTTQSNTLTVVLSGQYNVKGEGETPEYKPVTMTQTINNVKAGQWRKISISIEHANNGNVKFIVKVETWVYDSKIDVDVTSPFYAFGEETIPDEDNEVTDPDSPVFQLDGNHDIADPFRITSSIFDMDLQTCNDRISLVATPQAGSTITDAYAVFSSDNADFLAALEAAGCVGGKVSLYPTNGATPYMVIRTDAANRLIVKVNDAGMFGLFGYAGTHTAKLVVTDNLNRRSYTMMTISVVGESDSEAGPSIVWRGADIDRRYEVTSPMSVVVDITTETGITAFAVEILGDVLSSSDLEALGLASRMDLVNPATPAMRSALQSLGFLPKDGSSIEGLKSLTFDISELVPLTAALGSTGPCDFKLTATDASGTTVKTLMFTVL